MASKEYVDNLADAIEDLINASIIRRTVGQAETPKEFRVEATKDRLKKQLENIFTVQSSVEK
jgi:hypothetical protein